MKKRTTITDIARELNITAATVSKALNGQADVSEKTRKLIFETAERMDYHRNKMASSLRSGKTHVIGVIIPSAAHNFFGSIIHGIVNQADQHDYEILVHQSNESHEYEVRGVNALLGARVEGILASMARDTIDYSHFEKAVNKHTPVVFFDRFVEDIGMGTVMIDDFKGAYLATEHLIKQGYKRIAHITGPQQIKIFNERLQGYHAALRHYHFPSDQELVYEGDISIEAGYRGTEKLLSLDKAPDAIFAVEDFTALGVLKTLQRKNIKVPDEFGLFGFCNELSGQFTTPTLSTVDQKTIRMGEEAFNLLYSLISKREIKTNKIVLEPELLIRESSLRIKD